MRVSETISPKMHALGLKENLNNYPLISSGAREAEGQRSEANLIFLFTNVFSVNFCNQKCNGKRGEILGHPSRLYSSRKSVKMTNFPCNQKRGEILAHLKNLHSSSKTVKMHDFPCNQKNREILGHFSSLFIAGAKQSK